MNSAAVFEALPATESEFHALYSITYPINEVNEEGQDLLKKFYYSDLTFTLITATKLNPKEIPRLLEYGAVAISDVHSEFPHIAEKVCRAHNRQFQLAFQKLEPATRKWFADYVINPSNCRTVLGEE
jgi:hypothetical protein